MGPVNHPATNLRPVGETGFRSSAETALATATRLA